MVFYMSHIGLKTLNALIKSGAVNGGVGTAFSPLSLFIALMLVLNAADPSSPAYQELWSVLQPPSKASTTNPAGKTTSQPAATAAAEKRLNSQVSTRLRELTQSANLPGSSLTKLVVANAACIRNLNISPAYKNKMNTFYRALVMKVSSAKGVNDWTKKLTGGLIDKAVPDDFTFDAMLVNTIYFSAAWEYQFNPANTYERSFTTGDGGMVMVDTMSQTFNREDAIPANQRPVLFAAPSSTLPFDALRLPYKESSLSALFLLPDMAKYGSDVDAAVADLNLESLMDKTGWHEVPSAADEEVGLMVFLPKFKVRNEAVPLKQALSEIGLPSLFNAEAGNLKRLAQQEVMLTEMMQSVVVKVDEVGTEAAAITAGGVTITQAPRILEFNRPFIMLIVDDQHPDTILFMAIVKDPSQSA